MLYFRFLCAISAFFAFLLLFPYRSAGVVNIETVPVNNNGNMADTAAHSGNFAGQGSVGSAYNIGKYEVTAGQYTTFLNAVAKTDTYGLYDTGMADSDYGCKIQRAGSPNNYSYSVSGDWANRPVNFVNWGDAARFANWLHNGQPTGVQDFNTTEDGAYYLNGATSDSALATVARNTNSKWALPTEDEWYKAGYYDPSLDGGMGGYWNFPTRSNTAPGQDINDASGNNANYGTYASPIDAGKYTTSAGTFQNSASAYGTFDQGGNVWEWNEFVLNTSFRGLRGGSFATDENGLLSSYRDTKIPTTPFIADVGFRVVQLPEPSGIVIIELSVMGLLIPRRGSWRSAH